MSMLRCPLLSPVLEFAIWERYGQVGVQCTTHTAAQGAPMGEVIIPLVALRCSFRIFPTPKVLQRGRAGGHLPPHRPQPAHHLREIPHLLLEPGEWQSKQEAGPL